ncbi:glycerol-3-phosphate dehydrogenase/oxidase [Aquipuribacter sp. MA13-6]|uniref:glycerol-3-phosphate dehydrogenase/oxidase n=1 Tax=unclassified Aquipuribacter TaxID=2635084 RepID=UPI003EEDCC07
MTSAGASCWDAERRGRAWASLPGPWDVVVVGGGVVGAGTAGLAASGGARVLLLERHDFASGTSSRSSQQVHGGLRYLAQGEVGLARSAVHEREQLLRAAPGLVKPVDVVFPLRTGDRVRRLRYEAALTAYDALAGRARRHRVDARQLAYLVPDLEREGSIGGLRYSEAWTDDARLVLEVLRAGARAGATVLNHVGVTGLLRSGGQVVGVRAQDGPTGRQVEVEAAVVVNATGPWTDVLRAEVGGAPRMRPLRGSHLVVPGHRLPSPTGVVLSHPDDGRPVSVMPWHGATVVGTTDLEHPGALDGVGVTEAEVDYLLQALAQPYRSLGLGREDVVSTWSGVRPTVRTTAVDTTRELRSHVVWEESGLLSVAGGKLTTFQAMARDAVRAVARRVPLRSHAEPPPLDLGRRVVEVADVARPGELEPLLGTPFCVGDLRWAARAEAVVHLDDLLLRRTRLGLLLPDGGCELLDLLGEVCRDELGWDEQRWQDEVTTYLRLVRHEHAVPAAPVRRRTPHRPARRSQDPDQGLTTRTSSA